MHVIRHNDVSANKVLPLSIFYAKGLERIVQLGIS